MLRHRRSTNTLSRQAPLPLSLPKIRFVRIDGAARQGSDVQQHLRSVRSGACRSILRERDVSPHVIIIGGIFSKNSSKVLCVEHDPMISALASDRPDQAFYISVLPGRAERDRPVPDAHRSHASLERDAEYSVIVANEIFRCPLPRKRFGDLACQPLGRRISGHRNPQQPPPAMAENEKCE